MPRPLRPIADGLIYHVINRGNYRQRSFGRHGAGRGDGLLSPVVLYGAFAADPAVRRRSAYVHQTPDEAELAAIRRSKETGLPYGARSWVARLGRRRKPDLTIRLRARPRKAQTA